MGNFDTNEYRAQCEKKLAEQVFSPLGIPFSPEMLLSFSASAVTIDVIVEFTGTLQTMKVDAKPSAITNDTLLLNSADELLDFVQEATRNPDEDAIKKFIAATSKYNHFSITTNAKKAAYVEPCLDCNEKGYHTCDKCSGKGQYQCTKCSGTQKNPCNRCRQTGKVVCPDCNGKREVICKTCRGYGSGKIQCTRCKGRGKVEDKNCSKCDGSGEITCTVCSGEGKKRCTCEGGYLTCKDCRGRGSIPCSCCNSTGKEKCSKCGGTGRTECPDCHGEGAIAHISSVPMLLFPKHSHSYSAPLPDSIRSDIEKRPMLPANYVEMSLSYEEQVVDAGNYVYEKRHTLILPVATCELQLPGYVQHCIFVGVNHLLLQQEEIIPGFMEQHVSKLRTNSSLSMFDPNLDMKCAANIKNLFSIPIMRDSLNFYIAKKKGDDSGSATAKVLEEGAFNEIWKIADGLLDTMRSRFILAKFIIALLPTALLLFMPGIFSKNLLIALFSWGMVAAPLICWFAFIRWRRHYSEQSGINLSKIQGARPFKNLLHIVAIALIMYAAANVSRPDLLTSPPSIAAPVAATDAPKNQAPDPKTQSPTSEAQTQNLKTQTPDSPPKAPAARAQVPDFIPQTPVSEIQPSFSQGLSSDRPVSDKQQTAQTTHADFAPSFDCATASLTVERMICGNRELSELDVDLNDIYAKARNSANDKIALRDSQRAWVKDIRNTCQDAICLKEAYALRIRELRQGESVTSAYGQTGQDAQALQQPQQPTQSQKEPARAVPAVAPASTAPMSVTPAMVDASSTMPPSKAGNYVPQNVIDKDLKTPWVAQAGSGTGEWLLFSFNEQQNFSSVKICNGYQKSQDSFKNNNRVKKVVLEFSGGANTVIFLKDSMGCENFKLDNTRGNRVKLTILETYPGKKWKDTALSFVEFSARPK